MKPIRNPFTSFSARNLVATCSIALSMGLPCAEAATRYWDSNTTTAGAGAAPAGTWGTSAFWSSTADGTGTPATATTAAIDDLVFSAGTDAIGAYTVTVNGTQLVRRITVEEGSPTFSGGTLISLNTAGGITVAATAGNPVVSNSLAITGNQTFNIGAGRILTLNTGTFTRNAGSILNVQGSGTVTSALTGLSANNAAGILGTWASYGTGAVTQYATFSGSNIGGLTGVVAADGSALTDTTGLVNYDLSAGGGAVPAIVSANTIRYTGSVAGASAPGATSFSVNGLMNSGTAAWTIGTNALTIGAEKELVVNTANAAIAISSAIADNAGGASSLTKAGSGTLTLSGANLYSGPTTVVGGVLDVGLISNGSLGSGGLSLIGGTVLQGNGTFSRTVSSNITPGAGQISSLEGGFAAKGGVLTVDFGAELALSTSFRFGSNFVFGSPTADSKVVVVNPINLNGSSRIITVNSGLGGDYAEFSANVGQASGSWGITKSGTGRLVLSSLNNTYTGSTTLNAGALDVGLISNNSLGAGGLLFAGGVLQGNGTFTRNFNNGGLLAAAAGEIAGATGGFAANGGPLTVNFGGASLGVQLSGPSFRLGSGFTLGSATANDKVTVVNPMDLNGAVRVFTVTPGTGGDSAELSGVLSGATTAGVNKQGAGLLLVSGSNTYAGNTIVTAGILAISHANALGFAAAGAANNTSVVSGGSLQLTGGVVADATEPLTISGTGSTNVGALQAGTGGGTWAGPVTLGAISSRVGATTGNTLTITGAIAAGTTTGLAISGGGGTGVVILNPATANTYTGQTTIVRGILRLGKTDALPVTTVLDAKDPLNSTDAATFDLAGFNQTLAGLFDSGANANDLVTNSATATTSTLTLNNAAAAYTFDGVIENGAGTVALTKTGTFTQTLTGANTYSGDTAINVGIVSIKNNTALGNSTGITTIAATGTTTGVTAGGRLNLSNNITCAENITLTGNSEVTGGFNASIDSISDANTLTGNITLSGTGGQRINANGSLTINGPVSRDGANAGILVLRTATDTSTLTVNNTIDLNGAGMNVQGTGTVILNAAATEVTSATVAFGGPLLTLKLGVTNALPDTVDLTLGTTNVTAGNDQGNFDLAGFNQTVRALSGIHSAGVTPADATFRKVTNSGASPSLLTAGNTTAGGDVSTFDGVVENGTGGVALTKVGDGTLVLAATNTYTGATSVNSGTLSVTGSLAAGSAVTVGVSGKLGGTGTVNGAVTCNGIIAPGAGAAGTLTTGAVGLNGTLAVEIDGATGDKLLSTGAVSLSGPLTVALLGGGFTQPSYVIAEGSSLTGSFSSVPSGYAVTYSATQAILTQSAGSDYTTWTASFGLQNPWLGINPALNGESTADPDGDGLNNQQEYAFGLSPVSGSSASPITVQLDKTTGTFSYTRRATPATTGLVYTVKTSPDLVTWTTDATATATQNVTGSSGGVQTVQVTVSGSLPLTASKLFVRVEAK